MTVRRHREGAGVEAVDHVASGIRKRGNSSPSSRVFGIEVDPFVEFCHRDPEVDRRETNDPFPSPDQLSNPPGALLPKNFGVNTF